MRMCLKFVLAVFTLSVVLNGCKKEDDEVVETGEALNPKVLGLSITTVGYVDLEGGRVYKYSELTDDVKPLIDAIYYENKFWCHDDKIGNLSPKCIFGDGTDTNFKETSISVSQFDSATKDGILEGIEATEPAVTAVKDKVIYFETKAGKIGLIKVISFVEDESVTFDLLTSK